MDHYNILHNWFCTICSQVFPTVHCTLLCTSDGSVPPRFIAALGRAEVVANTLGTFTLLLTLVLGGFIVAKDDLQPWIKWGYYVSPMMYRQNANCPYNG
ncbi:hypothetical protein Q3G72_001111 [Acer saccharum]|nr:hypothetical protein Q3G72_001111 [Acer saccharum]